ELDRAAGRLAARLSALGVGPEARVGICLPRASEMVIACLAVWKAGGAYLPLDPAHPRERLAYMLEDAGSRLVLTARSLAGELGLAAWPCLYLDEPGEPGAGAARPARGEALPGNLAYLIYTSGSTGRPKGVAVAHR